MKNKIIDYVTFFDENYMFNLRYKILHEYVDHFIICESEYDHKGKKKRLNFKLEKNVNSKKISYIVLKEPFPKNNNPWKNQAIQRDSILKNIDFIDDEDYIFFSDPDEIPDPEILKNFELHKKYGIFMQKCFNFKFNLFNSYESPWEGTRVAKKKNLKSIDYMRQKVKKKNLNYNFLRIDKEKDIEIFDNAGWHFNNIMEAEKISMKLKSFAHEEYAKDEYSSIKNIENKIEKGIDLFGRGHVYKKVILDESYPKYILNNLKEFQKFIVK
jgi:beta-1,4-mannosyl-glycoprotein beta-1,4-N-acetylglucosaminyltransferase